MADSSQKFIARNRAPRVQIEYDVELYGAEKKVQLPFVMGVMSDLLGKSKVEQPAIADRKFLEIDADNFDERMKGLAPRAAFTVPNTLTGEGNLSVDLTFESMADFSPGAIAAKVDALRPLLEARTQLQNLMAYMDGKTGAEALIETILNDPSLLAAVSAPAADAQSAAALDSLRTLELPEAQADTTGDVLAGLAAQAPEDAEAEDAAGGVLAGLRAAAPEEPEADDGAADVLAGLSAAAPEDEDQGDEAGEALASLAAAEVPDAGESDQTGAVLEGLAQAEMPDAEEDTSGAVLAGLAAQEPEETAGEDAAGAALESLAAVEIAETAAEDASGVLDALADLDVPEAAVEKDHSAVLQGLAPAEVEEEAEDAAGAALESLAAVEVSEDAEEEVSGVLSGLADLEQAEEDSGAQAASALESLADAAVPDAEEEDGLEDVLGSLLEDAAEEEDAACETEDALESLAAAGIEDADDGEAEDILEGLLDAAPDDAPEEDDLSAVLDSLEAPEETEEADAAGDVLAGLADDLPEGDPEDETDLDDILGGLDAPDEETGEDGLTAALDTLEAPDDVEGEDSGLDDLLADLGSGVLEDEAEEDTADVLAELAGADEAEDTDSGDADLDALLSGGLDEDDDLDSLLGGLDAEEDTESDPDTLLGDAADEAVAEDAAEDSGLDDLLSGLDAGEEVDSADLDALLADDEAAEEDGGDDLDALLGGLDETVEDAGEDAGDSGLDDLLGGLDDDGGEKSGDGDLDSLLAGLGEEADAEEADGAESAEDDLDALLGGLGDADADLDSLMGDDGDVDLDDLLGGLGDDDEDTAGDGSDDLDALLGDLGDGGNAPAAETAGAELSDEPEFAYGTMSAERPAAQKLARKRFRMAVLGDFSGRAAKGQLETGDALAARKAILLDPDTVEDVIERFATELVLPIGKQGAGIAVKLEDLDGLHPDELYENVELFSELAGLRKQLQSGATADHAAKTLKAWAEKYGTRARAPKRTSAGNAVPADKRLSAFQQLIKDTGITPRAASPVEDLLARVVGPHIRALPDPDLAAMQKAVDEALSDAMRLVLHHPEFQSVEAQWRSLDLMARSIEADDTLDVVLYDISAEELAADLAAEDDLSRTGLVRLLTEEPLDEENGRGGYSVLIGMYQFEETPPHAELLGRIARVAAHVDAPFFASISPEFLKTPKAERPKLVAEAWDTLQGMTEAGHLGLVSPRFLLRRPYGEKTEPCYEFDFEEFTETEGLKGMLWANPVVLVAILLGRSFKEFGPSLQLGEIMSLGGMPYHYVSDRFGDQVALPCTERNIDLNKIAMAQERGFMAVSAVKGRDEVRLTSFNSLKGSQILGPWTGLPAPEPSPPDPRGLPEPPVPAGGGDDNDLDLGGDDGGEFGLDDLDLGEDDDGLDLSGLDFDAEDGGLDDLDDLLSSFGDDGDEDDDDGGEEMDAELAALLDDL
ncbi:type VI secretion system contractile sheath small subunit (plasmid) [Leisingera aquaemixtae]|nr:type VI secretion system contractile sheath small subunit [Leisingera aquaemixtae]